MWTALSDGHGGFPASNFVMANFGYQSIVLALMANDRVAGSKGIWRSPDGGSTWTQVHKFPAGESVGQLVWALGSDHLVYVAGGSSLAISKDAGATFVDALPWGTGPAKRVNHVAVWQKPPSDPYPAVIYALGNSTMFLSFDGGTTWMAGSGGASELVDVSPESGWGGEYDCEFEFADRDGDLAEVCARGVYLRKWQRRRYAARDLARRLFAIPFRQ